MRTSRRASQSNSGTRADLRLDHVMGLDRLWMIPAGASATDGAYVHYEADEQWATVTLAAFRNRASIIGEDLGTVPPATDRAIRRHRALGMWVVQFELPDDEDVVAEPPGGGSPGVPRHA